MLFTENMSKKKKHQYNAHICEVEHKSFTSLVFASTRGMSKETIKLIKRLASNMAKKEGEDYAHRMGLLHVSPCIQANASRYHHAGWFPLPSKHQT
jgi:hypothetical protein